MSVGLKSLSVVSPGMQWSIVINLSVGLSANISPKPHIQTLPNFLHMLRMDLARSSTDGIAIHDMYFRFSV